MRFLKTLVWLMFAAPFLSSCNKVTCELEPSEKLAGNWKWVSTDGGLANHIHNTPLSTGTQMELRLTADGRYGFYTNEVLIFEGNYTTTSKVCIHDQKQKTWIQFSNHPEQNRMVESLDQALLVLSDEAYDGLTTKYAKKTGR